VTEEIFLGKLGKKTIGTRGLEMSSGKSDSRGEYAATTKLASWYDRKGRTTYLVARFKIASKEGLRVRVAPQANRTKTASCSERYVLKTGGKSTVNNYREISEARKATMEKKTHVIGSRSDAFCHVKISSIGVRVC
jgi:hypothetical protein